MTRNQEIRKECLLQLYGAQRLWLLHSFIHRKAQNAGFDFTRDEILNGLFFLVGQGFATSATDPGTGEVRYQITSAGILHRESNE